MDKGTSNTSASVLINAPASRDPRPQNQLPDSSRDADFRGLIPASFPLPGREYHLFGMATTRQTGLLPSGRRSGHYWCTYWMVGKKRVDLDEFGERVQTAQNVRQKLVALADVRYHNPTGSAGSESLGSEHALRGSPQKFYTTKPNDIAMTESKDPNRNLPQQGTLEALHRQHAIWTIKRFRFLHPDLTSVLYKSDGWFIVHVSALGELKFPELQKVFDSEIRPAGSPIRLSEAAPQAGVPVEEETSYGAELWLNGVPLPAWLVNKLLGVAAPDVPEGSFDYAREEDTWLFRSRKDLSETERASVAAATAKLGYLGPIRFITVPTVSPVRNDTLQNQKTEESLELVTAREIGLSTGSLRQLVERDEEEWRQFLDARANQKSATPPLNSQEFACLYDVADNSEIRLSELLTLYDRIDVLPSRHDLAWLEKHRVSLDDLQELVRMKRVRLVLPHSADKYPERLLSAVSEVDSSSLVLSRTLASKTILHGQYKEPILYAPLTSKQRWSVLAALSSVATDKMSRVLLASYSRLFQDQHDVFMTRGALASTGFGVGSYLGELFYQLRSQDARVELMTCGAAIEWALGLGASFIPRDFGLYDETANSMLVASYLGRLCRCSKIMSPLNCNETLSPCKDGDHESERVPTGESD
jgi:hypothetical protein